jgi:hypothetical protein
MSNVSAMLSVIPGSSTVMAVVDASVPAYVPVLAAVHTTFDEPAATDVTVTVCAVLAFAGVKVIAPDTVACAVALLTQVTMTLALGILPSTTVYVAVCAAFVLEVMEMAVSLAVTAAASTVTVVDMVCVVW